MPEPLTITWSMSLENAHAIIGILGEQPFNKIAPMLMELRTITERQALTWQQTQQPQPGASQSGVPLPSRMNGGGGNAEHAA